MGIVNVIGDSMSAQELVDTMGAYLRKPHIDAVFFYNYTNYAGMYALMHFQCLKLEH